MNKLILGAALTLGLLLGANTASMASPGEGLDRNAAATGNGRMGGMHAGARSGSIDEPSDERDADDAASPPPSLPLIDQLLE